jgi:hypothetical protein
MPLYGGFYAKAARWVPAFAGTTDNWIVKQPARLRPGIGKAGMTTRIL